MVDANSMAAKTRLVLPLMIFALVDEGLLEAVKLVEARLKANVGEKGGE